MKREPTSKTLNVIVVSDERSPVRRFSLDSALVKRGIAGAGAVLLGLSLALVDYVRLRVQAVDVDRLRAQTTAQQATVDQVQTSLEDLEGELARLREFERKVRVIANLPSSQPAPAGGPENGGQGGGGPEFGELLAPPGLDGADDLPGADAAPPASEREDAWLRENALDAAALARVTAKAERLGPLASARAASFEELVEKLQGQSLRLASTPSIVPARGWLTSGFGYRTSPFTGRPQFHAGLDVASNPGTEIVAPARGRVVFVGRKGPLGKAVVIDHGYGVRTTYGHTADAFVQPGETVERGQRIASIGMSGRTTGPHLHYAVEVNGEPRNPIDYIVE
jgi:murein DD-endopeptidase MepM/ murein hydrolase activator NlpD